MLWKTIHTVKCSPFMPLETKVKGHGCGESIGLGAGLTWDVAVIVTATWVSLGSTPEQLASQAPTLVAMVTFLPFFFFFFFFCLCCCVFRESNLGQGPMRSFKQCTSLAATILHGR